MIKSMINSKTKNQFANFRNKVIFPMMICVCQLKKETVLF